MLIRCRPPVFGWVLLCDLEPSTIEIKQHVNNLAAIDEVRAEVTAGGTLVLLWMFWIEIRPSLFVSPYH